MPNLGIGRVISIALLVMVVIAIWRANNGDLSQIATSIWNVLNEGADLITTLWRSFISSGQLEETLTSSRS